MCVLHPGDQGETGEEGNQGKVGKNGPPGLPGIPNDGRTEPKGHTTVLYLFQPYKTDD